MRTRGAVADAEVAMTTGTVLVFIITGTIALVAIVGGIWLEARMPDPHQGQSADLLELAGDAIVTLGRHRR
jgi:hypothetical protein